MDFKTMTIEQLEARKAEISGIIDSVVEENELSEIRDEINGLNAELEARKALESQKAELRKAVAGGAGVPSTQGTPKASDVEGRAEILKKTNRASYDANEVRSVLMSSGTLAAPTGINGINDIAALGAPILDAISIEDCKGMTANKVAYVVTEGTAADQTQEGAEVGGTEPTFNYVTIQPATIACKAQISKQAKKQTPLNYEAKVNQLALKALRKAAAVKVASALNASSLVKTTTTAINENTLRNLVLDCDADGSCSIAMTKAHLATLGAIRGADKKPVYDIIPDASVAGKGIIKEGGLSARYFINDNLSTIFYGDFSTVELDLFGDYEIAVSSDFAITSLMDTIVGDVEVGADVVAKHTICKVVEPVG